METMTRRDAIRRFGLAGMAAAMAPRDLFAQDKILLGEGRHTYEWIRNWAKLPEGMKFVGRTHGYVAIDSKDRAYFNTDTENSIMVFESDGTFVKSWGKQFTKVHGMWVTKEGGREIVWICARGENEVVKCTLDGEVLLTIPYPEKSGVYKDKTEYKPTGVCVGPNGDVYVGDGYGKSWVHQWTGAGEYVRSWDGSAREGGKFKTPHGMCADLRGPEPRIIVADRENGRLQWFTLDGKFVAEAKEGLRRPCTVMIRDGDLLVPDLQGRVTILDKDNKLVVHMGENDDPAKQAKFPIKPEEWKDGQFISPHGAAWDSRGDLYVEDWNESGRINKLRRVV